MLLPHTITSAMAGARSADALRTAAARRSRQLPPAPAPAPLDVTIRTARTADAPALERLAQLDGRGDGWIAAVTGRWGVADGLAEVLIAESGGTILAARPLRAKAPAIADPFRPSAAAVALLDVRAAQLAGAAAVELPARPWSMRTLAPRVGGAR